MMATQLLTGALGGNLADRSAAEFAARTIEWVSITSDDLAKRILRLPTSLGDVGLRVPGGTVLRDGDVVFEDATHIVALEVLPDALLVIRPTSIAQALAIAHAIGNRHLPVQIEGDALIVRDERLVAALLDERAVPYERVARTLSAPFRHAHAPHDH